MSIVSLRVPVAKEKSMSLRANALADRLQEGALELAKLTAALTVAEWTTTMSPTDPRRVGVVVHHVASQYPIEIKFALMVAEGTAIEGVSWTDVAAINAEHAKNFPAPTREAALELLRVNSSSAAAAIRLLSDEELDRATANSLYGGAVLTCQFMLEDHAVRHAWHHLAKIRSALNR